MVKKKEIYNIITSAWSLIKMMIEKEQLTDHDWEQIINKADEETKKHSGAEFVFARKVFCAVLDYLEEIGKEKDERS